jgi:hypothetical protein
VVALSNPSCDRAVMLSPPRLWLKPPLDDCCSSGVGILLLPPQHDVALSNRESGGVAQVALCSSLYAKHRMKVVKSVKMKPLRSLLLACCHFALCLRDFGGLRFKLLNTFEDPPPARQGSRRAVFSSSCVGMHGALLISV